jgi:hypothetical protein
VSQVASSAHTVETKPPGLATDRLVRLMRSALDDCRVDLSGASVVTEGGSGAYAATPVLAAWAGAAEVIAITRSTRYGSAGDIAESIRSLAAAAGVAGRISVTTERRDRDFARADVVTNSGHVRPIDRRMVSVMKPSAVVPLMFEAWEVNIGRSDVDIDALRARGISVAGTNERHPAVDVFSYLGLMAVRLLLEAAITPCHGHIALVCDNPFREYLVRGLAGAGADVTVSENVRALIHCRVPDAIVLALKPRGAPVLSHRDATALADRWPGTPIVQFWGDLDRLHLAELGLPVWPPQEPAPGHMGILPSAVGPDPIVRLQAGGLKVAQVLLLPAVRRTSKDLEFLDEL